MKPHPICETQIYPQNTLSENTAHTQNTVSLPPCCDFFHKRKKNRLFVVHNSVCSAIKRLFRDLQQRRISVGVMPVNNRNGEQTAHGGWRHKAPSST